jgi:hypothetical protein
MRQRADLEFLSCLLPVFGLLSFGFCVLKTENGGSSFFPVPSRQEACVAKKGSPLKRVLIGIYLFCALLYFFLMNHRVTADPSKYYRTHQLQSLTLAGESLLFPLYLTYYYLQGETYRSFRNRPVWPQL